MPKSKKQPDKALALIGVSDVEWWPSVCATADGAHKLTEAIVTMAYHALEEERKSGSDIPPLMIGKKLNLAYEAVLRERALYYLQSLKLEADASIVEILSDIFQRQLYMHHPDQWRSLAEFLKNMAAGKSASYQSVIERLVTVILPFLQVEELCSIQQMMELITEGGMSNLYHLLPNLTMAVEGGDRETMEELLRDAKSLGRQEIFNKYKKTRIPSAYATLGLHNPGPLHVTMEEKVAFLPRRDGQKWQLVIEMTEAQKGVILNRLGRRISYE